MARTSASNVQAMTRLASYNILALEHNPRNITQGGLEVKGILFFDLFFSHQIITSTIAGINRSNRVGVRGFCYGNLFQYCLFFLFSFLWFFC